GVVTFGIGWFGMTPPAIEFVPAPTDRGTRFFCRCSISFVASLLGIPRLWVRSVLAMPLLKLDQRPDMLWPTRAPIPVRPWLAGAPNMPFLVYGRGCGFSLAIAGEIKGSRRYAIGSVGWKMLKTLAHLGDEVVISTYVGFLLLESPVETSKNGS